MRYFISLSSTKISDSEAKILRSNYLAGVVLFGKNIASYKTTKKFITEIKSVNKDLLVAVDEEGGIVSRFSHLIPNFSQPYCSTLSLGEVKKYYNFRSRFLKEIGIDINFAPVVDLVFNENAYMYKRSYIGNIAKVIELSKVCIEEQRKAGLASCIKHFPGHGRSVEDSHKGLPVINITERV